MANYETTSQEAIDNFQTYDEEVQKAVESFVSEKFTADQAVTIGEFTSVEEAQADKTANVVVIKLPEGVDAATFQFDDSDLDNGVDGRIYIFEGTDGVSAVFNTVDRVIVGTEGDDEFVVNGDRNTTVEGGLGNDTITTSGGDDIIYGGAGNDVISSGEGNDSVFGGQGTDTVSFTGNQSDYSIEQNGAITVVTNTVTGSVSQIVNSESLVFADGNMAIEQSSEVSALVTLYNQMFSGTEAREGGQADLVGLQYWSNEVDNGLSLGGAVRWMLSGEESGEALVGLDLTVAEDRTTVVETLFTNVLGRDADADELASWTAQIEDGASIEDVAQSLVETDEFQNNLVDADDQDFMLTDPTNGTDFFI